MISAERAKHIQDGKLSDDVAGYEWNINYFNEAVSVALIGGKDSAFIEGMEYYYNDSKRSQWIIYQLKELGYKVEADVDMMNYGVTLTWKGE